jgi:hypothetical protein
MKAQYDQRSIIEQTLAVDAPNTLDVKVLVASDVLLIINNKECP